MDYLICNCTGYKKHEKLIQLKSTLIRKRMSLHKENINNDEYKINLRKKDEGINLSEKNFLGL